MGLATIDIEKLANQFGDDFVSINTGLVMGAILTEAPFLASANIFAPFLRDTLKELVSYVIRYLGHNIGLIAFQFNTYVWTSDQGKDYIAAVEAVSKLPENVSDADWIAAEVEKNVAFSRLWALRS